MIPALSLFLAASLGCDSPWSARYLSGRAVQGFVELTQSGQMRRIAVPWPVWTVQRGDVDRDGCDELILGVTKKNRFDSLAHRRLQVWRIDRGHLRPGWLGTRLGGTLDTFALDGAGRVVARERTARGWLLARWRWNTFGFQRDSILDTSFAKPRFPDLPRKALP